MSSNAKKIVVMVTISVCIVVIAIVTAIGISSSGSGEGKSLEELLKKVNYTSATPTKASISLEDTSLYDELPDIERYSLAVQGHGDIDIEIFTSGEKAGANNDSWLIDCAESFNSRNITTASGKTVSMSIRSVSSGLAADYIISEKYLPDLYTPSNTLFGEYAIANGGNLELYNARLVGNTAGLLVKKDSDCSMPVDVINEVVNGSMNMGYTNPQTSATGLNLLLDILKRHGDVSSDEAATLFRKFNDNIPFVAVTTQQMALSAANGTLDGMVTEYQAYINSENLKSLYKFIPFGMRHDNPLYIVDKESKSVEELEAIELINKHLCSTEMQDIATRYGFNANDDFANTYSATGADVTQALKVYKAEKDAGKDIIAVFVADCSGSMSGAPIRELKESLTNGMQYIKDNSYVGLVSYSNSVTIEVPIAQFDLNQKAYFQGGVNKLAAGGGTNSYSAICVAMKMVEEAKVDHPDAKCMIFLLSDGYVTGGLSINQIVPAVKASEIPIYTIGYTSAADMDSLQNLSGINEAASIKADSDDIMYQIKSLFNAQL